MLRADNNMGVSVHSHMSKPLDIYMREREREREREICKIEREFLT